MFFYEGMSCPVCSRPFKEDDDIVSCPECGAPHHRECWQRENRCAYAADHGTDRQWSREKAAASAQSGQQVKRCPNCGAENPAHAEFCGHCGRELQADPWQSSANHAGPYQSYQAPPGGYPPPYSQPQPGPYSEYAPFRSPFADPCGGVPANEIIDGETAADLAAVAGPNAAYYVPRFSKMSRKGTRASWNWPAFLIPVYWLMYRKQYLSGCLMLLFNITQTVLINVVFAGALSQTSYDAMFDAIGTMFSRPGSGAIIGALVMALSISELLLRIIFGVFGNRLYMRHCLSVIRKARKKDPVDYRSRLAVMGGTSFALGFIAYMCAQILPMMVLLLLQ